MYRTAGSIGWAAIALLLALFLLGDAVLRAGWAETALLAPWVLLGLWVVYTALYASAVTTDAGGVTVQNMLRRTRIPWPQVAGVELLTQLTVLTADGEKILCLGGPILSRAVRGRSAEGKASRSGRTLESIRADGDRARAAGAPDGPVRRSWDLPALAAFAVIAVWAAVAVLVTR